MGGGGGELGELGGRFVAIEFAVGRFGGGGFLPVSAVWGARGGGRLDCLCRCGGRRGRWCWSRRGSDCRSQGLGLGACGLDVRTCVRQCRCLLLLNDVEASKFH